MTKADLIKALDEFPDNEQVVFTLSGAKHYFWVDKVAAVPFVNRPCIESDDAVDYEDIVGMADACLGALKNVMSTYEVQALQDFLTAAGEIENES